MGASRLRWHRIVAFAIALVSFHSSSMVNAIPATYCSPENTADGPPMHPSYISETKCEKVCGYDEWAFSIVQGESCWCSDIAPEIKLPLSRCHTPCSGYPEEDCGDKGENLFNYLALGLKPKGTSGSPGPKQSPTDYDPSPSPTTITKTSTASDTRTVFKTNSVHGSVTTKTFTKETKSVVTQTVVKTTRRRITRPVQSTSSPSSSTSSTSSSPVTGVPPTTIISSIVITVHGTLTTSYVSASPASGTSPEVTETHSGISGGAIAGIVIGTIVAIAAISLCIYFCCWRRGRSGSNDDDDDAALNRNTSVLSKVGLLRKSSQRNAAPSSSATAAVASSSNARAVTPISARPPMLQTDIPQVSGGPSSAATAGTMLSRRDSRPLFVDQRLNPNAVMANENQSQTSIGTLQDDQDYSRPLEVRNPDVR